MEKRISVSFFIVLLLSISVAFNVDNAMKHLQEFENIAYEVGNGNRAAGSTGYNASASYVFSYIKENTSLIVSAQNFPFYTYSVAETPILKQVSPYSINYVYQADFGVVRYSSSGELTAPIQDVGDACSSDSFTDFIPGNIAMAIMGSCSIGVKVQNAIAFGAGAVFLYNSEPGSGYGVGSLENPEDIVVFGMGYDLAKSFLDSTPTPTFYVKSVIDSVLSYTVNIIADSPGGDANNVVVFGAHLDSVPAGPGINDDGSGSATVLEFASAFSSYMNTHPIQNKIRFCWWGAEELGKIGSRYYVNQLVESGEISTIAAYYNFDMVGSPNYMRAVYDGATAPAELQSASIKLQQVLQDYFEFDGLNYVLTPFGTGSDYYYFLQNGVPSGGLFTGTSTIKSMEYRTLFGGIANAGYDPCYHQPCDTVENISVEVLDQNGKSGYYAILEMSQMTNLRDYLNSNISSVHTTKFLRHIETSPSDE